MTGRQRVVACVASRGSALLVCQRPPHKRHGGLWEFPGGKTKPGESDRDAAARELREELGVTLTDASSPIYEVDDPGSPFTIAFVPVQLDGEPACLEHSQLLWDAPSALARLPLAPSDQAFVRFLLEDLRMNDA